MDPYYTDGFRGVLIFDSHPTALTEIKFLFWDGRKEMAFWPDSSRQATARGLRWNLRPCMGQATHAAVAARL